VAAPCLIFHGLLDEVAPADCSREFARRRPGAELHLIEDGHELLLQIDGICARALQFLRD
jgi:pimeloyl-ACP methyl ester carboxylesterase